jgi:hypothetical protein
MAEKDLFHGSGNASQVSYPKMKKNTGTNKYGAQSKAPFLPTKKIVNPGWSK